MNARISVSDIVATVETLSGHPLNGDEGALLGPQDREVEKALACWMATREALAEAERVGADLVVAHEALFYPYGVKLDPNDPQPWESWPTNRHRREIAERAGMTVMRVHGSADDICIYDDFLAMLKLDGETEGEGRRKVMTIPPTPFGALVERVKQAVGMAHVRVSCRDADVDREVRRVGFPWGGLGLDSNVEYQEWTIEQGCDALIAGESDSYGFRFSAGCGVPMIETSHEVSEIPGMRRFMEMLAERHPGASFAFHDNGNAWRWM